MQMPKLAKDLPSPGTGSSRSDRRVSLPPRRPTFPLHLPHYKPLLFAQNPNQGPAIDSTNLDLPSVKRCEVALDESLYLPKHDDNFYGRFITLGYHNTSGPTSNPLRTRSERNKTFELWKRKTPNGWKFVVDQESGARTTTVVTASTRERLRTMTINAPERERSSSIRVATLDRPDKLVQYTLIPSLDHDLFQFGRDQYNNDFHLPGHVMEGHTWYLQWPHGTHDHRDPVSRLAFRVQCSRKSPGELRIAAAGFDHANELFLGPNALRWSTGDGEQQGGVDGGITVGLYLWKPKAEGSADDLAMGSWYEISALGEVYHLRNGNKRGRKAAGVDNLLTDGCIVVNANSVLLFTTVPPSKDPDFLTPEVLSSRLEAITDTLCPITYDQIPMRKAMMSTAGAPIQLDLALPSPPTDEAADRAGVFPACGHVFQLPPPHIRLTSCPKCRVIGKMVPLVLQTAPTFLAKDAEFTHVLPCGHAVSEALGKRMVAVPLPTNELLLGETEARTWGICLSGRKRRCWFCGTGLYATDLKKLYFEHE
jgi:Pellino